MEQYRLSRRREAGCAARLRRAEAFAQVHREVRDVELLAGHDERNPLSDEARAVVRAQPRSDEYDDRVNGRADKGNMLSDVGRGGGVVGGREEDAWLSSYVAFKKAVHPGKKRGEARRAFERSDPCGFVKGIFEIALERGGDRHCQYFAGWC